MGRDKYLELFVEEGKEHIQILNENLLRLEEDMHSTSAVDEIFRAAHTLKGMAGSLGFNVIAKITHNMENILDEIRSQKRKATSTLIDLLFESTDTLDELIEDVSILGKEGERDVEVILFKLNDSLYSSTEGGDNGWNKNESVQLDQYQSKIIRLGIEQGLTPYWINVKLQPTCLLKAARAYMVFHAMEGFGEIIKSIPQVQDIEEEKFDDTFSLLVLTKYDWCKIKADLESISEIHSVNINKLDLDLEADKVDDQSLGYANLTNHKRDPSIDTPQKPYKSSSSHMRNIRVDVDRLDYLMNLVSELITIKNTMEDIGGFSVESGMAESMEYLARVTNELHDAVMQVRMVPIEMVFSLFPRVVRDLARDTQKRIKLNIIGSETEIDRTIVDEIGDPLIHLLRNAIDHGIEPPDERIKKGKDPEGTVDLIAYHDGNSVVVEIKDDGHGIDLDKISNIAQEKGLISREAADTLGEKEIINLMFLPGFSTAQSVSNISGRGVGMDVVKTKVESLGGTIDVDTQIGLGSRFIIRLPLTLSIIQALLVKISDLVFAIPLNSIQEIIDFHTREVSNLRGQEVIPYRGNLIPLIRLEDELNIEGVKKKGEVLTVVVIKKGEKQSALSIGNLIGQQEVVIKSLGKYLSNIKVISGATILGNGQVALILDINRLI